MMSWAKVVQAEPEPAAPRPAPAPADARSVAVVDANAIIAGVQLHTLAEQLVTVPEVLAELRDVRTRQALEALPVRLHMREPLEDAVKAGASRPLPRVPPLLRSAAYGDCCRACSSASRLSRSRHGRHASVGAYEAAPSCGIGGRHCLRKRVLAVARRLRPARRRGRQ